MCIFFYPRVNQNIGEISVIPRPWKKAVKVICEVTVCLKFIIYSICIHKSILYILIFVEQNEMISCGGKLYKITRDHFCPKKSQLDRLCPKLFFTFSTFCLFVASNCAPTLLITGQGCSECSRFTFSL